MIIGVYGYHNSGKTLFLEKLINELEKRGISAAVIKHLGRHYDSERKKDTGRLAAANFNPVIGVADDETIIRLKGGIGLQEAIGLSRSLVTADVLFVEGFKNEPIDKIAVGDIEDIPGTKFRSEQFDEIVDYIENTVKSERISSGSCSCSRK